MSDVHGGGCLCRAVRYAVRGPLRPVVACHCSQCQRSSGSYVMATGAARADLEITGEVTWYESSPGVERGFCGCCGASLFWAGTDRSRISIGAGTLDAPTGLALRGHIYVADKGDYYQIADGLPQWPGSDTGATKP